jgi:sulfite reductase alpha subunit-like flavoprotein
MPGLTATEKSHWRDRIASRIGRSIERIKARHPALFDRVARQSHAQALATLGLVESYAELEAIKAEESTLTRRKKQAQRRMVATLRGQPIDEVADSFNIRYGSELGLPNEVAEAIAKRQAAHQEQMLADDPIGREIARLEVEKVSFLDTVWLACSPDQIKQLWTRVGELLGDEPTTLERQALAIEPAKEA